MRKPIKYVEKAAVAAAKGAWVVFDRLNRINPGASPTPKWSDKPLLKSYEKSKPPLGWPLRPIRSARNVSRKFASRFSTANCRTKF